MNIIRQEKKEKGKKIIDPKKIKTALIQVMMVIQISNLLWIKINMLLG
jgi:hypothetical protein